MTTNPPLGTAGIEPRVEGVLRRTFGDSTALVSLDRLSGGASQETYKVVFRTSADADEQTLALRRASGGRAHNPKGANPGLEVEAALFRAAAAAGIPEPEVVAVLDDDDGLGPGFLLEWLDGETLGPRIVRAPEFAEVRPKLARQCGEILGRIHTIDVEASALDQELSTVTPEAFIRATWQNYQSYDTVQPMIDYTARWLLANLPPTKKPQLVHNDFRNGNLMVDPERGIIAVLDWELAHLGDPLRDLGWVCCNSWRFGGDLPVGGFGTREDLFAGYESVTGESVDPDQVKFWEVFGSFWWAVGTLGMAQQFRNGPDPSVERVSIGRRTSECQMDCVNLLFPGSFVLEDVDATATDLSHSSELLSGVRDFLRNEVMAATAGRVGFLSRVSANSLDIVLRELALDGKHLSKESRRLGELGFAPDSQPETAGDLKSQVYEQRRKLVAALENGDIALDDAALQAHLRQTTAQQLAIDQPKYSALRNHGSA